MLKSRSAPCLCDGYASRERMKAYRAVHPYLLLAGCAVLLWLLVSACVLLVETAA